MGNLDYTQVLNKIENTRRFGNEPGVVVTAQVIKVLREKGKQKRIIPYIHVAGTNGKGSVCAFFSSILKKEHMRVGTFVSPHLVDFEERITVDGRMIPKEDVTRLGNCLLDIDFGIGLRMFDYCLAMALCTLRSSSAIIWSLRQGSEAGLTQQMQSAHRNVPLLQR